MLTKEIEKNDDKFLSQNISALLYLETDKTLDWIEKVIVRTNNIYTDWGTLTAASKFSWTRAERWLNQGRPLSLIAIDALLFCTTSDKRTNQSFWLQQHPPKLIDEPSVEIVANKLKEYLFGDNVPRTKTTINMIIENLLL